MGVRLVCKKPYHISVVILLMILSQIAPVINNSKSQDGKEISCNDGTSVPMIQVADCNATFTSSSRPLSGSKFSEIPISMTETLSLWPKGKISNVYHVNDRFVIRGSNYIYMNGTDRIFQVNDTILSMCYEDIDSDGKFEFAVITTSKAYLLDDDLKIIWSLNINRAYDEISFAMLSNLGPLIILWKRGSGEIAYYSISGRLLNETTVMYASNPVQLLDIDYSGDYLLGLIRHPNINLIVNWTYYNPVATRLVSIAPCTPMMRVGGIVYTIGCIEIDCFIIRIQEGSVTYLSVTNSLNWETLVRGLKRFACMDMDYDGSIEFLVYNASFLALIDTTSNTSGVAGVYMLSGPIDQAAMYCEGVVVLAGNDLKVYDKTMILRGVFKVEDECILLDDLSDIVAITKRGSCLHIRGSDLSISRPFINAGWDYRVDKNTLIIYNAHHAAAFWVDQSITFSTHKVILSALPATDSAILVFDTDIIVIQKGGKITSMNLNAADCLMADSDGNKIYMVRNNGTLSIYSITTGVIASWNPPSGYKPVSIHSYGGNWIYSLMKNTTGRAEIAVYINGNLARTIQISLQNSNNAGAFVVVGDKDRDNEFEIAYVVYVKNATLHWNYTMGIIESSSIVWNTSPRVLRALEWTFSVVSLAGSYGFVNNTMVRRVFTDGSAEIISLGEQVLGGCESGVFSGKKMVVLTSRGKAMLDFDGCHACLGKYGLFSSVLYINQSYYFKNLTLVLDLAPPKVTILAPSTGQLFNQSAVSVSWKIMDDLRVKGAELYLDGAFVCSIETEGELILKNLTEGNHSITIVAWDHIDRVNENTTWFVIDIPLILEVQAPNGTWQTTSVVSVTIKVYGGVEIISIFRNATKLINPQPNTTVSIELAMGINVIRIEAVGYRDLSSKVFIIGYDPEPPIINLIEPRNNTIIRTKAERTQINITLSIEDLSGISKIILIYKNYRLEIPTQISLDLGIGEYYFIIGAYDLAGNYASIVLHIIVEREVLESAKLPFRETHAFVIALLAGIALGIIRMRMGRRERYAVLH